jgi:hypothetical protein
MEIVTRLEATGDRTPGYFDLDDPGFPPPRE